MTRVYLDVPFGEKDEAKAAGARWDPQVRRWYAPRPGITALDRWTAAPELPTVLPGEDRSFGHGCFVDLVPKSCWFTNVRSVVSQADWERIRRVVVSRAGDRCEACGAGRDPGSRRWLEVHERWEYFPSEGIQRLRRLICLCSDCHLATHLGYAATQGRADEAMAHLGRVNRWSARDVQAHVDEAYEVWARRSRRLWELDVSMLRSVGIECTPPPDAALRDIEASQVLQQTSDRRER